MPEDAGLDIDFDADTQLAEIQAITADVEPAITKEAVPGAVPGTVENIRSVELKGKSFRIADKIGAMPLLRFSTFANMNIQDPRALSAMYTLLRDVIYQGEPACGECETCATRALRGLRGLQKPSTPVLPEHPGREGLRQLRTRRVGRLRGARHGLKG